MLTDWKDYYDGNAASYYDTDKILNLRPTDQPEINYIYLLKCIFINCTNENTSDGKGGVISCVSDKASVLVEYCSAIECSAYSDYNGGFVYSESCNLVINSVCTYKCWANFGQSICAFTSTNVNHKNSIIQSSICSTFTLKGKSSPIYFASGKLSCSYANVSKHKVKSTSALSLYTDANIPAITYSSFVSNFAIDNECIYLDGSGISYEFSNCNILNNIDGKPTSSATISAYQSVTLQNCCILNNFANALFYTSDSGGVTLKTCTLPETYSINGAGFSNTKNAATAQTFINNIMIVKSEKYCIENLKPYFYVSAFPVVVFPYESKTFSSNQRSVKEKSTTSDLVESLLYSSLVGYLKQ